VVAAEKEESQGRRSSSRSSKKGQARHYVISSSSSGSRSRSSSRSSGRSRSPKYRLVRRRHKHSHRRYHSSSRHRSLSRSRSRSHSHGASASQKTEKSFDKKPYFGGTNSSDPKMIASRLFIGSLPFDISKDDLRAIYSRYGKIIGKNTLLLVAIASYFLCSVFDKKL